MSTVTDDAADKIMCKIFLLEVGPYFTFGLCVESQFGVTCPYVLPIHRISIETCFTGAEG